MLRWVALLHVVLFHTQYTMNKRHENLQQLAHSRVIVVGDVMLDRYWQGATSRISPEAPVPIVAIDKQQERPGGAANVAQNVVALGAQCTLFGLIGNDEEGRRLRLLLEELGVQNQLVETYGSTITKLRVLSRNQQLVRLDFEHSYSPSAIQALSAQCISSFAVADVVIFSDYGKGSLGDVTRLIDAARSQQIPVVVDPKGHDFSRYRGATLITPNAAEFQAIVGPCKTDTEFATKASTLCADLQLEALLITRGERGMTLVFGAAECLHIPTQAREVYDVTGAGDTVIATLAAALGSRMTLTDAVYLANQAAGIVVGKAGAATASIEELRVSAQHTSTIKTGIMTEAELLQQIAQARLQGERIVFTNGCFDILHAGHVHYLQQASDRGERLLVAVNDDDSVRRLKGERRPINPLANRMAVLAALKSVDWVVAFSEDTPARLIEAVSPQVLVKGGDYQIEKIVGARHVQETGGEVVVLDYLEGDSTTKIINTCTAVIGETR